MVDERTYTSETYNENSIRDYLQTRFDTTSKPFLKEIVLLVAIYLFYVNVESNVLITACKYAIVLFVIRYILAILTDIRTNIRTNTRTITRTNEITNEITNKITNARTNAVTNTRTKNKSSRYFQINGHLILFCIILFLLNFKDYMMWILIISYSLLVISSQEHYTSDIIMTVFLVHYVYKLELVKWITLPQ
jgi:hypothetical protein